MTEERQQPYDLDAEAGVLGAMLLDPEAIDRALLLLSADSFYSQAHAKLFSAIIEMRGEDVPVDPVTLSAQLGPEGLESIGGLPFIYGIAGAVPTAANVVYHAKIVREKALLRRAIKELTALLTEAYEGPESIDDYVNRAERAVMGLQNEKTSGGYSEIKSVVMAVMDDLEAKHKGLKDKIGLPSGYYDLDRMTAGLNKSALIVIAGRPGMGKTAFALNIAANLHVPVGIFSLEMSEEQITERLLAIRSGLNLQAIISAALSDPAWERLSEAGKAIYNSEIFIDDTGGITAQEIRAKARRMKREKNIGLLIVDYIQLIRVPGKIDSRNREIGIITNELKTMAKELEIPVIALSQLNRDIETRTNPRPRLADLRDGGSIEQDADVVEFLYRPEMAGIRTQNDHSTEGLAEVYLEKNKNGPTGFVELLFVKESTRFENLSYGEEPR